MLEKAFEKSKTLEKNKSTITEPEKTQNNDLSITETVEPKKAKLKNHQDIVKFDWDFLKSNGFIMVDDSHSRIAEEYRAIKRPLVTNAIGSRKSDIKNSNLILITSSVPGEGKTFTSINLAFSIAAEMDKKVLLIDADVAKPSIAKVLGIESKVGLIDFLETDTLQLSDIILQTEIPGLRIITAGKSHKFSTELLASDKMIALSKELSERYSDRIVIFDTPPLLATTQAEVLASQMGQVILVVAAEKTPQSYVLESTKKLQNCSDIVLGVLNKAQRTLNASYYGYGHY